MKGDCLSFSKEFRAQWKRLPNGFYACKDMTAKRKSVFNTNRYLLEQNWDKHVDCFTELSPKQVRRLFGRPSSIVNGKNEVENFKSKSYYYYIQDTSCNTKMEYPFIAGAYSCNWLRFAFYNKKQRPKSKPMLTLFYE
jgi:hypothetical protein